MLSVKNVVKKNFSHIWIRLYILSKHTHYRTGTLLVYFYLVITLDCYKMKNLKLGFLKAILSQLNVLTTGSQTLKYLKNCQPFYSKLNFVSMDITYNKVSFSLALIRYLISFSNSKYNLFYFYLNYFFVIKVCSTNIVYMTY